MSRLKDLRRPGYVPLTPVEWQRALATMLQIVAGNIPGPPPHAGLVGPRGEAFIAPDTPFNKGVIAACIPLMDQPAKPMSFLARVKQPFKIAREDPNSRNCATTRTAGCTPPWRRQSLRCRSTIARRRRR